MLVPSEQPPAPGAPGRLVALVVLVGAVIGVAAVLLLWARGRTPTAYVPPARPSVSSSATTSAVASATASAPQPPPSSPASDVVAAVAPAPAPASASTPPAPVGTTGTITVPESRAGHRIYVEQRVVGESPGTFTVRCGVHAVKVGSQGNVRNVNVPCGGDVEVK
jgi:pyruvate/2-oxoglutarate dehydrogenase complex dihydrolipoamide acyltransferase (E2) component